MTSTHTERARTAAHARAVVLLSKMTLEEKTAQLVGCIPGAFITETGANPQLMRAVIGSGVGHVSNFGLFGHKTPVLLASTINDIQRFLVEQTRLGIPATFHNEALSGVVAPHHTAFPAPSALAATFDPTLVKQMSEVIRRQMRRVGFTQALAPVMDVARDARWGRYHETYGEDVLLVTAMSVAYTRGLQGDDPATGVMATAKHFLGYSATEAGQNMAATHLGARELFDVHATPFAAAIHEAGLAGVMNSYSEIDGVPVGASREVLTDLLRDRLGFTGSVISDYHTVGYLYERNRVADSYADAGAQALRAGIDMELPVALGFGPLLAEEARAGRVAEQDIDTAVIRILTDKFASGIIDAPYVSIDPIELRASAAEGATLARKIAEQAVTLLKNDEQLLPLDPSTSARVAIIGPLGNLPSSGVPNYTYPAMVLMLQDIIEETDASIAGIPATDELFPGPAKEQHARELAPVYQQGAEQYIRDTYGSITLVDAMRSHLPEATVSYTRGTGVTADEPTDIAAAVAAARDADVVVLALGGRAAASGAHITEGEGNDLADIELPDNQLQLAEAVAATGTPVVAVLSLGKPYALAALDPHVSAMLTTYYSGPNANAAAAAAIVGATNPAGRLPFTLPKATGQLPIYYSQKTGSGYRRTPDDMFTGYLDLDHRPYLPFGHGISYTSFEYGPLETDADQVDIAGVIEFRIAVTNTGHRAGDEVVQLYATDTAPGVTRPGQQLVAFRRVSLAAGEAVQVTFTLPVAMLGYTGTDGKFGVDPGPIVFKAGASSDDIRSSETIYIVGDRRLLSDDRAYLSSSSIAAHAVA